MPRAPKPPPGKLSLAIAAQLRVEMGLQNSMGKSELARRAGLDRTLVSDIVRGLQQADVEELDKLCQALGLSLTEVIKNAEDASYSRRLD